MDHTEWLHDILDRMREDIIEIKQEIKELRELKFKILGGVFVISSILTVAINVIVAMIRLP